MEAFEITEKKSSVNWTANDFLEKLSPKASYYFIAILTLFGMAIFLISFFTNVAVTVDGEGKITSESKPIPIKSTAELTVDRLLVQENQFIKKDTIILQSKESVSDKDREVIRKYKDILLKVVALAKTSPSCSICIRQLDDAQNLYGQLRVQGSMVDLLSQTHAQSRDLKDALRNYESLPQLTADIRFSIDQAQRKISEIKKRKAENLLARELEALTNELVGNQTRLRGRTQESANAVKTLTDRLQSALIDLANKSEYMGKMFEVKAPFDGVVTNVKVKGSGELVQAGFPILELVPSDTKLIAELRINDRDVPQVKDGLAVKLTFDALPESEYGSVDGTLKSISRQDAVDPLAPNPTNYIAAVTLSKQSLKSDNQEAPIMLGMSVRGKVIIKYESMFSLAIKKLFYIKSEFGLSK